MSRLLSPGDAGGSWLLQCLLGLRIKRVGLGRGLVADRLGLLVKTLGLDVCCILDLIALRTKRLGGRLLRSVSGLCRLIFLAAKRFRRSRSVVGYAGCGSGLLVLLLARFLCGPMSRRQSQQGPNRDRCGFHAKILSGMDGGWYVPPSVLSIVTLGKMASRSAER